jgi:hypothetical protein
MTAAQSFAFLVSLVALFMLYDRQTVCGRCGGRGAHRNDCPDAEDKD